MGSETSKPQGGPEAEWEGGGNQFHMISPVSDLSNPSDINKCHRASTQQAPDRNRRASRTVTKTLSNNSNPSKQVPEPSAFYFPTRETERYAERKSRRSDEEQIALNKENERPKGTFKTIVQKTQQAMTGCFDSSNAEQMELERRQSADIVRSSKTKAAASKEADRKGKSSQREESTKQRRVSDLDAAKRSSELGDRKTRKKSITHESGMQKLLSAAENTFVIREAEGLVDPEEYINLASNQKNSATLGIAGMALHHEDDYFARLTANQGRYGEVHALSYVTNGENPLANLPSALGDCKKFVPSHSPMSSLYLEDDEPKKKETIADSKPTTYDAAGTSESLNKNPEAIPASRTADRRTSRSSSNGHSSPVSSLLRFQSQIGQLPSNPEVYSDEEDTSVEVFLDETGDSSNPELGKNRFSSEGPQAKSGDQSVQSHPSTAESKASIVTIGSLLLASHQGIQALEEEKVADVRHKTGALAIYDQNQSDDDSAVLSYFRPEENRASAFRSQPALPEDPLKQIASLGRSRGPTSKKVSKLESLFRPVLPALSSDDAQSITSYDPFEIKVTESAPGALASSDYRAMALRSSDGSPKNSHTYKSDQLSTFSPSMMSIDSQIEQSPAMTRVLVSDQARYNAEFLFASDDGKAKLQQKPARSNRDSSMFSISTIGARSRLSRGSTRAEAVTIPRKSTQTVVSDESSRGSDSERHVRFSTDTLSTTSKSESFARARKEIDVPGIERKFSDLTDTMSDFGSRSSVVSAKSSRQKLSSNNTVIDKEIPEPISEELVEPDEDSSQPRVHWSYTVKDGVSAVTPHLKGTLKNATNSPYLRYQAAKSKYESKPALEHTNTAISVPAIESKVSDLTDAVGDLEGRSKRVSSEGLIEEVQNSESVEDSVPGSPEMQVHWSYSIKDGDLSAVTPHLKGRSVTNATNSPFVRFKSAKNKFANPTTKTLPVKSPKKKNIIKVRKAGGGVVSSRIADLNGRVREARKLKKKHRASMGNPRKYSVVETNVIRTQSIMNYKTDMIGLEKRNAMGAAKFNRIPDLSDDELSLGSEPSDINLEHHDSINPPRVAPSDQGHYFQHETTEENEEEFEDDISKLSKDSTLATVRQGKQSDIPIYQPRASETTHSTASSGFSKVRKQVFRTTNSVGSRSRQSVSSYGESTTLSSILGKENENYLPFRSAVNTVKPTEQHIVTEPEELHLSPTQRTPMQARKWRSLAAAAKQRDSQKKPSGNKGRKGLSVRHSNKTYAI